MFGNSPFGFIGAGGGGGGGTIGGGGTLNYLCKFTPDGTNIGNSMFFDNGISAGLGTVTPDASAILDLTSTSQGFLTPRMTTVERDAIAAPINGLFIYNTSTSFFNYWNGSTWIQIDTSTGGDVSGSGTTNRAVLWTDGGNSVIGDATWYYSTNDYLPVTTGSNIGDATHRIGTIFMASVFDYANDLNWVTSASTKMTLTTSGNLGVGIASPLSRLHCENNFNDIVSVIRASNTSAGTSAGVSFNAYNGTNAVEFGILSTTHTTFGASYGLANDVYLRSSSGAGKLNIINSSGNAIVLGSSPATPLMWVNPNTASFGANLSDSLSTKVYIQGGDSTSSNYSLKVDNSASSPLFYVRNDGNAFMGNNTAVSVASPIALDLGGQYSSTNGLNPKLIIYNNNNVVKAGLGVSYNGSGQTEIFTYSASSAFDYTWYHGSSVLARLGSNTLTLHRNEPNLTYGFAINFDLNNSLAVQKTYAVVSGGIVDNTSGSEDGFLKFFTSTAGSLTEKMVINEVGNVGIGVISPSELLELAVDGKIKSGNARLELYDGTNGYTYFTNSFVGASFYMSLSNGASIFNFTSSSIGGALLIDGTVANAKLSVKGFGTIDTYLGLSHQNSSSSDIFRTYDSGKVIIGTGNVATTPEKLTVYGGNIALEFDQYVGYLPNGGAQYGKIKFYNGSNGNFEFNKSFNGSYYDFQHQGTSLVTIGSSSAQLYVKGVDATSSNYALKVDNSATSPLLYVRNDANVGVSVATPTARFHSVGANATEFVYNFKFYNSTGSRYLQMDNDGTIESVGRLNIIWANNVDFTAFRVVAQSSQIINVQGGGNGTVCVGAGVADTNTRLHTKGVDATSSNYAFKADNSASSNIAHFRNDQFVGLGTTTEIIGATGHKFEQNGVFNGALGADYLFSAAFSTSNSYGIDIGAGIALGGKYNSGGLINPFAGISGVKLNATDGNYEGRLNLWVRNGSSAANSFTSIPFGSKVRNGMGIKNPTALLHLSGDNADVFISESGCINTNGYAAKLLANTVNTQNNIALFAQATNGLKNYAAIFEGNININVQIGNAGLASGDLYVDTAANILANGDLIVARKV